MDSFFFKSRRKFISHLAICSSLAYILDTHCCYAQTLHPLLAFSLSPTTPEQDEPRFTVNFNNTSVIEVIRFVSKISGANFVFSETDLAFNVTIVSEEPIPAKNIVSALVQVLRINDLKLLEQEGNFLITPSSSSVNQIPTIVSGDAPILNPITTPIVTRIFAVKNTDVAAFVKIIKPMTSKSSLIDVFEPTQQLIVTDITTNIDKIALLLRTLDVPYSNLEIESYSAMNVSLEELTSLTKQILASFTDKNPFILVPQEDRNTIFIVSTPYLVERALSIMEDLDKPAQIQPENSINATKNTLYVYKPIHQTTQTILSFLHNSSGQIPKASNASLLFAIQGALVDEDTKSLAFVTDPKTWNQIRALLTSLDSPNPGPSNNAFQFYTYALSEGNEPRMTAALKDLAHTTKDQDLIQVIKTMHWVSDTNSLVFYGSVDALAKIERILPTLNPSLRNDTSHFEFYTFPLGDADQLRVTTALKNLANTTQDQDLIQVIKTMHWVSDTNSLVFYGSVDALAKVAKVLPTLNPPLKNNTSGFEFYTFPLADADQLRVTTALKNLANTTQDQDLIQVIKTMHWVSDTNSLVFYGSVDALAKVAKVLPTLNPPLKNDTSGFEFYTFPLADADQSRVTTALKNLADTTQDQDLIQIIKTMHWVEDTHNLVFYGSPSALTKVQKILSMLQTNTSSFQFYTYALAQGDEPRMTAALQNLASTTQDPDLIQIIKTAHWVQDTNSLVFYGSPDALAKLQKVLPTLEAFSRNNTSSFQFYTYKISDGSQDRLTAALKALAHTTQDQDLIQVIKTMHWVADTSSLVFYGSPDMLVKVQTILPTLNKAGSTASFQFYTYKVTDGSQEVLTAALKKLAHTTQDQSLIDVIQTMHWVADTNSLIFYGSPETLAKIQNILPTLSSSGLQSESFLYKPNHVLIDQLFTSLKAVAKDTQDQDLMQAVEAARVLPDNNLLVFRSFKATLEKIQTLLSTLDVPKDLKSHLLLYKPKYETGEALEKDMRDLIENFKMSGLQNSALLSSLDSMKWVVSSQSLVFSGDQPSLNRIQVILNDLDLPSANQSTSHILLYKPSYATQIQFQEALASYTKQLHPSNASDQTLIQVIYKAEWIPESKSFLFRSDSATLTRLKEILSSLDTPKNLDSLQSPEFHLYHLQYAKGDAVIEQLITLASHLPAADPNAAVLSESIKTLKWIKDNNSIFITGSLDTINQVKTLISEFDTAAMAPASSSQTELLNQSDFFIYKPINQSPEQVKKSLQALAEDLKMSGLPNQDLIQSLLHVQIVPATESLIIMGSLDTITKIKTLLSAIDRSSGNAIQEVGNTTFLIYKIKQASSQELLQSLQSFGEKLLHSEITDSDLVTALKSVKWIQETNSLLFTGPQEALKKVQNLAEKFDLESPPATVAVRPAPPSFVVYVPKAQTGSELITILYEFMQNLIHSGVSDPCLFDAINHLRFIPKTNSLIISGDNASIEKIQGLLAKFDIQTAEENASISAIDTANFLIYKLQYHPGAEIQMALKKVGASLNQSSPDANRALINAVESLQWIEVTNSLIGTGDAEILAKLKELILNLDVPLRQVFIEVLVVETTLFNSQNFGLQWGSQLQYLNKTIGAMGNFPSTINKILNSNNVQTGTVDLSNPISFTTNTNPPVQGNSAVSTTAVPFATGFDLGVIGDIIFHKGQSFISLGSLLNALQMDNDTTVVMNPKIITQDGHTSNIFVGQNIPFVGSFVSNTASNTVQSSNIEYRNVGVNLTITPALGSNDIVTLDIQQDISEQTNSTTHIQGTQVTGIQTSQTTMSTRVHVPDRHFLVLSGMIQDTKTHFRTSIPCLGGLPVIGALFSENDRFDTKDNIIIFLRPFIIDSFEDYNHLTAAEEALYKQQAGYQDLKEEFDAATETIKDLAND